MLDHGPITYIDESTSILSHGARGSWNSDVRNETLTCPFSDLQNRHLVENKFGRLVDSIHDIFLFDSLPPSASGLLALSDGPAHGHRV